MKNLLKLLLVVMLGIGFTGCVNSDFEEIQEDGIMVPASTDPDDDDEVDAETGSTNVNNN